MRKMFLVMRHEILISLKRKTFLFFSLGLPLILLVIALVFMLVNRNRQPADEPEPGVAALVTQGYVDFAGLVESEPPDIPAGTLQRFADEAAAAAALEAGEIGGYFLIPAGYLEGGELTYVTNEYSPFAGNANTRTVEWLLVTNLLGDAEQALAVWQPIIVELNQLERPGEVAVDEENWIVELLPTLMVFIIYMAIIIPAGALVNAVTDEKKNRVIESILVSVSPRQFISGKILALGLLGLLQITMYMAVIYIVVQFGGQALSIPTGFEIDKMLLVWIVIYSLFGYAMYGVLMAGLGALVPDVKDARSASFYLLIPLVVAYMFNMVVIDRPDGMLALFLSLFPLTAPVSMIARMGWSDVPLWQGILSGVLQLGTAVVLMLLVARLFQAHYLLSGQPFSMKRYFGALAGRV